MRHLVIRAATVLLLFASAAPVAADTIVASTSAVYDTVDAVELHSYRLTITGIVHGTSNATTLTYQILDLNTNFSTEAASRCDRLALLMMAKPGKYQLAMQRPFSSFQGFSCKLTVVAP
ncbi:MAG TPA: hypothetical protein VF516_06205 [Kofleriaceae bacterium]